MKRVRLRIKPRDISIHPAYARATGGADYLSAVELIDWNVSTEPIGQLLRIEGDAAAAADDLDQMSKIVDYSIRAIDENSFYLYVQCMSTAILRRLMNSFTNGSLLVVPPVECHQDGSLLMTFVGSSTEIQAAIDGVPKGITTTIEEVGGGEIHRDGIANQLSDRQREAIITGIEVGYYDTPRQATNNDIATSMGCSPSTASEHLRKAESKLIKSIFE